MTVESDVAEVHDREGEGSNADEYWPEGYEEVGQRGIDDGWIASYVFKNVEPVSLNDNG